MVNLGAYESNSNDPNCLARFPVDQLRSIQLEPVVNPIPDCPCEAVKLPTVNSFIDSQLRRDPLEAVHETFDACNAFPDQFKQIGYDKGQSPIMPFIALDIKPIAGIYRHVNSGVLVNL